MGNIFESETRIRAKGIIATLAAVILAVAIVFSSVYLICHEEHDCSHDESCPICICIEGCKKITGDTLLAASNKAQATILCLAVLLVLSLWLFAPQSLTNLKIRLNN